MKTLVIGLGSMGKRRIRLLKRIKPYMEIIGVDFNCDRRSFAQKEYGIETYDCIEKALVNCDIESAIVSTSPLSHPDIIYQCLQAGMHVFTELNLVAERYEENIELAAKNKKVLFLSSTFLYRDEIQFIMERVRRSDSKVNYCYHVGQYLPDWHPWETYKDFFIGDRKTNGCREILAIEIPWLEKAFGKVKSFQVMRDKNTNLNINYMDNYLLLFEHESGNKGMLAVDVVSRKAVRNLEIFGETLYLSWDGTPTGLKEYDIEHKEERKIQLYSDVDKLAGYSDFVIENDYTNELINFFEVVSGEGTARYTFEEDLETLKLIDKIEGITNG